MHGWRNVTAALGRVVAFAAFLLLAGGLCFPSAVSACPVCDSGTGQAVRAGIFGQDFGFNLFVTAVPFLIFGIIITGIYYGPPREWRRRTPGAGTDS